MQLSQLQRSTQNSIHNKHSIAADSTGYCATKVITVLYVKVRFRGWRGVTANAR